MSLIARSGSRAVNAEDRVGPAPSASEGFNAILEQGTTFEGKLVFEGTVHINGHFIGEIRSKDTLVIGKQGKVQGDVDVGTLVVNGELTGQVRARESLTMHAPARVKGSVATPMLQVDRGVVFEGTTKMENLDAPAPATPPAKA